MTNPEARQIAEWSQTYTFYTGLSGYSQAATDIKTLGAAYLALEARCAENGEVVGRLEANLKYTRHRQAHWRMRCKALEKALAFYAKGYWVEGYPGGCRKNERSNTLDFGETARAALDNGGRKDGL